MIDKQRFAFGTVDNGTKIHILPLDPGWGTGPACGIFYNARHLRIAWSINDVDCLRCKRKVIYRELLREAEKQPANKLRERLISLGSVEKPFCAPQESAYKRPHLVFKSEEKIRCACVSLVVRTDALKEKYEGGLRAFVQEHQPRCNRKLAVLCSMGFEDLDEAFRDLQKNELSLGEDFECFDAMSRAMGYEAMKDFGGDLSEEAKFEAEWLGGYVGNGGVIVYYAGE